MKNQKVLDSVLEFIKHNPDSSIESITVGTKNSDILVRSAIKSLQSEDAIIADQDTGTYSINVEEKAETEPAESSPPALNGKKVQPKTEAKESKQKITSTVGAKVVSIAEKKKEDESDLGPKTFTGRDNSKYNFAGQKNLPKGRLVLALVRAYVEKSPKIGLSKLQELFHSEEIQPRYGIIVELSAAKKFSKNNVDRFFVKNSEDVIKLANGTKIAVCNQWTAESLNQLLKVVASHPIGFKVKVEEAAE